MQNRVERYSKIRAGLDSPYSQKPSPNQILNAMLVAEQTLNLRLTNSRQAWSLISSTLTTVADQSVYPITQPVSGNQNSGKVYFVVRSTANTDAPYLPVPFDDFSDQDYGRMPPIGAVNQQLIVPEKISFYRANMQNQVINAVIQPAPREALTYTIWFFVGAVDRAYSLMTGTGPMIELADYLDMKAMLSLLGYAEWRDDDVYNDNKRRTLAMTIGAQVTELEPIVATYINNINHPKSFNMDFWND